LPCKCFQEGISIQTLLCPVLLQDTSLDSQRCFFLHRADQSLLRASQTQNMDNCFCGGNLNVRLTSTIPSGFESQVLPTEVQRRR
jgi:hypothetical protein